jgi:hypothetical protein
MSQSKPQPLSFSRQTPVRIARARLRCTSTLMMNAVQSILGMLSDIAGEEQLFEARNSLLHLPCLPLLSRNSSAIRAVAFAAGRLRSTCPVVCCQTRMFVR